jgi:hypothetical protein
MALTVAKMLLKISLQEQLFITLSTHCDIFHRITIAGGSLHNNTFTNTSSMLDGNSTLG